MAYTLEEWDYSDDLSLEAAIEHFREHRRLVVLLDRDNDQSFIIVGDMRRKEIDLQQGKILLDVVNAPDFPKYQVIQDEGSDVIPAQYAPPPRRVPLPNNKWVRSTNMPEWSVCLDPGSEHFGWKMREVWISATDGTWERGSALDHEEIHYACCKEELREHWALFDALLQHRLKLIKGD